MTEKRLEKSDPSPLTTQLVWREVQSLKELLETRVGGVEKGIEVAHQDLVRVPTEVQKAVGGLQTLMETKIYYEAQIAALRRTNIENHLNWLEKMRVEAKAETDIKVQTAFNSAKELNTEQYTNILTLLNKMETMTMKQIDTLSTQVNVNTNNTNEKITDLKDLVHSGSSQRTGTKEAYENIKSLIPIIIAVITFIVLYVVIGKK